MASTAGSWTSLTFGDVARTRARAVAPPAAAMLREALRAASPTRRARIARLMSNLQAVPNVKRWVKVDGFAQVRF